MRITSRDGDPVHHMKVTIVGQVSLPAAVRRRWGTTRVKVTDLGDRLVVEPEPDNRFDLFVGVLAPADGLSEPRCPS